MVAKEHGHRITTMLSVYVAWTEGAVEADFFRANRRQIVNMEFILSVELGKSGRLHVQLRDGPEIEISRRQARLFRARTTV